jgi:TPR repeat protein
VLAEDGFIYHKECIKKYIHPETAVLISPMTGEELGCRLIFSRTIESTLEDLEKCERDCMDVNKEIDKKVSETILNAKIGDLTSMTTLGRWYLFGEQQGIGKDEPRGYDLVKRAAEGNDEAKAYLGHCLIRGLGVEKNKQEGYILLVETATDGRGVGRGTCLYLEFSIMRNA